MSECGLVANKVVKSGVSRKVRRSKPKKKDHEEITIMYANIQGFTGKKTSLLHIMESIQPGVVLLAETMTRKVQLRGCQSIYPKVSVGQMSRHWFLGKHAHIKR